MTPAQTYIYIVRKRFDLFRKQEKRLREAAFLIVECVLNRGALWTFDREEALLWEANVKAAGLFITNNQYTPESPVAPGDILLIAAVEPDIRENIALAEKVRRKGGRIIAITSTSLNGRKPRGKLLTEVSDIILDNHSPEVLGVLSGGKRGNAFCPTTGVMNDCIFWALCAAVVDEFLARGKIPTVYRGVHLFDGREYNARAALRFKEKGY